MAIVISAVAVKTSAFEFIRSQELGLGRTILLSQPSATDMLTVPSGMMQPGEGLIELGLNRKFDIKDFDQGFMAGAYRYKFMTFALGFTQFGYREFYAERTGKLNIAYHHQEWTGGVSVSAMQIDFGGVYEALSALGFGGGIAYKHDRWQGALSVENINSPRLDDGSEALEPLVSLFGELTGKGAFSLTGRLTIQNREKPQLGVGQRVRLSEYGALFWGISTEPTVYGGGVQLDYRRNSFNYATSYHPVLGFSHTFTLGYHLGGTRTQANERS